ncbi:MAG: CheR family methyltransferase [Bacteriovoracaceae bacterium]
MNPLKKHVHASWDINTLSDHISQIIEKESGNVLGKNQSSMVINRLKKRLIDLGDLSPDEYFNHLNKNHQSEVSYLISLMTTHHTFFFREFSHFEYLLKNLDNIVNNLKSRNETKLKILSAACSRGQEVYSLAMFFNYHLKNFPGITFEIIGTDIDPESVKIANNGVYSYSEVKSIPQMYLQDNWQRGTGEISRFAKVKSNLKNHCNFKTMNLLKTEEVLTGQKFDIILCRNVFIYFDLSDVEKIVGNFRKYLHKNALFITGLSESLKSIDIQKQTLAPSIYCFDSEAKVIPINKNIIEQQSKNTITSLIPKPIKILAVDDSTSILSLLTKIFSNDPDFQLVGTAKNGLEAQEFLAKNKVDAMTLDIHMPQMDGVEYLKKNYKKGHPHVIVVSSASREDTRYAQETLKNGACDFVEKPALNNITERADEIKNKIKMAFLNSGATVTKLDKSFAKSFEIKNAKDKARFMVASYSDKNKVINTLNDLRGEQPPTFIFFEGNSNFLDIIKNEMTSIKNLIVYEENMTFNCNTVYLCDFKKHFEQITKKFNSKKISNSIFGIVSASVEKVLIQSNLGQILIEDTESINQQIKEVATDVFPWTSFSHIATEFLAKDE